MVMTRIDPSQSHSKPQNVCTFNSNPRAQRVPLPYNAEEEPANSEDELEHKPENAAEQAELEVRFEERLKSRGLHIRRMVEDGNCLFRAVSDRVYGDAGMHDVVRRLCMDHMEKERDHFSQYITQDFDAYIRRKRRDGTFGNHLEIQARSFPSSEAQRAHTPSHGALAMTQALSEIYNRPVHVSDVRNDGEAPVNAFTAPSEGEAGTPLQLSYHGRSHYNVIIDPARADVGEGLGLPNFQPGLADRMQIEAVRSCPPS